MDRLLFVTTGFGCGDLGVDWIPGRLCVKFEFKAALKRG